MDRAVDSCELDLQLTFQQIQHSTNPELKKPFQLSLAPLLFDGFAREEDGY
jgi:hypothetical protein